VKKLKRMKKPKMPKAEHMGMMHEPKPVSIHLHAQGSHMQEAHDDLARQLKPFGFSQKKAHKLGKGSKKTIGEALSS